MRYLVDVGAGCLANRGQGVDGGDSLSEHGIGSEFGKLRRPEADGQNSLLTIANASVKRARTMIMVTLTEPSWHRRRTRTGMPKYPPQFAGIR
jgi:hypothetical protein